MGNCPMGQTTVCLRYVVIVCYHSDMQKQSIIASIVTELEKVESVEHLKRLLTLVYTEASAVGQFQFSESQHNIKTDSHAHQESALGHER
jgi:hypothetical protein